MSLQYSKVDSTRCNSKCSGNSDEICGGEQTISVYSTGIGKIIYSVFSKQESKEISCFLKRLPSKKIPVFVLQILNEIYFS